ncbi:hypothetical protein TNCV_1761461 [Trichonephila clavipes]|nr:hypothetical protein TNCV_1761461 [Trichonephila clavipes]
MIRAWCLSGLNLQKGLIYVKYVQPQTFYQWCCVDSSSGGVLVTIPCVKWLKDSILHVFITGPTYEPRVGQGRLSLSSFQWNNELVSSLLGNLILGNSHETDQLIEASAHAPLDPRACGNSDPEYGLETCQTAIDSAKSQHLLSTKIVRKDFVGMYHLLIIAGSCDPGKALSHKTRGSTTQRSQLREESEVFTA